MVDIMSILSTAYKSNVLSSTTSSSKYVAVDSTLYQGNWTGTYADGKTFSLNISSVDGFRAQIHYQSGGTSQYQQVLIKDSSFRFGNTKFTLAGSGKAQIKNVVTDPATGSNYLDTAVATRAT
ncbi:hypothetical protein AYJ54_43820 [Bradyrhizobium centrolobii]|uniref:Uncharacterized protein n=1 Tax=Bradyrhizobium centrolobii TaxID=1505087 RepID=A0A176Z172_9BRAD|nr:hypothetical protein [Bradyrhizobium centrolobii]OAF13650.1 hypothetical protein AYJ54_43820 [Bradyrhizobium centrolobii]